MNIPLVDLKRQYKSIKKKIDAAIKQQLKDQYWVLGNELKAFEEDFANYLGSKYVVGVDNGSDGLILALKALGIGSGHEVITPVNSFTSTTFAITEVGATPVFVDVDPNTHQIDVYQTEKCITKKTKAILPVHLYGSPCNMGRLMELSQIHRVPIIEDACQAHGASYNGQRLGSLGTMGVFSFYPGKNLGGYGNGGAICTNDKTIYEFLIKARNFGQPKRYYHEFISQNSKLDDLQASILRVKLPHLDTWNKARAKIAESYKKKLSAYKTPSVEKNGVSNNHLFVLELENRDDLLQHLNNKGIQALIHYPIPIHLQQCYAYLNHKKGDFPIAEGIANKIISLPIFAELMEEEILYITNAIHEWASKEREHRNISSKKGNFSLIKAHV